jgi:hypothetical protein
MAVSVIEAAWLACTYAPGGKGYARLAEAWNAKFYSHDIIQQEDDPDRTEGGASPPFTKTKSDGVELLEPTFVLDHA